MTRLQELLIQKISSTKDERLLQEVNRLLETGMEEEVYQLSPEQVAGIEEAKAQLKNGEFISHEEANKEIAEWLRNQ